MAAYRRVYDSRHLQAVSFHSTRFNQSLLDLFNLVDLRLILMLMCDSVNLIVISTKGSLLHTLVTAKNVRDHSIVRHSVVYSVSKYKNRNNQSFRLIWQTLFDQ